MSSRIHNIGQVGFYAAVATTLLTLVTFVIAFLTPPLSGPYCVSGCYDYPFADIASRFPRDYYWMYPAMLLYVAYAVLVVCIHQAAAVEKKVFATLGLYFGLFSAAVFIVDFFVQVSVIPPSLANGETDGVAMLSQFNAHGLFIVLEELGYLLMCLSFLFFAPLFTNGRLQKSVGIIFIAAFALAVALFAFYSFEFGIRREYRFEVAVITVCWLTLIVSGILLALYFKRLKATLSPIPTAYESAGVAA